MDREKRRGEWLPAALVATVVAVSVIYAFYLTVPQRPAPAAPSESEFSSERAMRHVEEIARAPHPSGSEEHRRVLEYLTSAIESSGITPEIQSTTAYRAPDPGSGGHGYRATNVENILARIPGTSSTGAILLVAHYDSVPTGPGAADDGAGVAAILETLRALQHGPPLQNDVIALFTDAEESGLMGAVAFVEEHPWAGEVKRIVNLEARGSGGKVHFFEGWRIDGDLIDAYSSAARAPSTGSAFVEVYRRLPNDTDFSILKRLDVPGLNLAFIGELPNYHTTLDSPQNLDRGSLQEMGTIALGLARSFGDDDLSSGSEQGFTFFNWGPILLRYPEWVAYALSALVGAVYLTAVMVGFRRGIVGLGGMVRGALSTVAALAVSAGATFGILFVVSRIDPAYGLLLRGPAGLRFVETYNGEFYAASICLLAAAITCCGYALARGPSGGRKAAALEVALGAVFVGLLPAAGATLALPNSAYLFVWPLLVWSAVLLSWSVSDGRGRVGGAEAQRYLRPPLGVLLATATAASASVVFMVPLIVTAYHAVSLGRSLLPALQTVMLVGLLFPALELVVSRRRWLPAGVLAAGSLVLIAQGALSSGFSPEHPRPDSIFYVRDEGAPGAVWMSPDPAPDAFTAALFGDAPVVEPPPSLYPQDVPAMSRFLVAEAPPMTDLTGPDVSVVKTSPSEGRLPGEGVRRGRLHIKSPRGAPIVTVLLEVTGTIESLSINGRELAVGNPERARLVYSNVPPEGFELAFDSRAPSEKERSAGRAPVAGVGSTTSPTARLRVADMSYGIPADLGVPARPPGFRPGFWGDQTWTFADVSLWVE